MVNHGKSLKSFLEKNNISRSYLVKKSGLNKYTLDNMISGKSNRIDNFEIIAKSLGVPLGVLLSEHEENFSPDKIFKATNIIIQCFHEYNIEEISPSMYHSIFTKTINFINENKSDEMIKMYLMGISENLR